MLMTNTFTSVLVAATLFGVANGHDNNNNILNHVQSQRQLQASGNVYEETISIDDRHTNRQLGEGETITDEHYNNHHHRQLASWEIQFLGLDADFSIDSTHEVAANYTIGKSREYATNLYAKDCTSAITGIEITKVEYTESYDSNNDLLMLKYDFNKTEITSSNIWNATSSKIEACQVVQLIISSNGWVISEDIRVLDIDFDLTADFGNAGSGGGGGITAFGTVEGGDGGGGGGSASFSTEQINTTLTSFVEACKCDEGTYTCNTDALVPSTELFVCIKSTSSDVEINYLDSMSLTQDTTTLEVIANGIETFPELTTVEYNSTLNMVVVSTFVPSNVFTFAAGESISIGGDVEMQFITSGGGVRRRNLRHLSVTVESAVDVAEGDDAPPDEPQVMGSNYQLEVALLQEQGMSNGDDPSMHASSTEDSNAMMIAGSSFVGIGCIALLLLVATRRRKKGEE